MQVVEGEIGRPEARIIVISGCPSAVDPRVDQIVSAKQRQTRSLC
jgi:hypothetical protein